VAVKAAAGAVSSSSLQGRGVGDSHEGPLKNRGNPA
jgi:hypothetical protein